MVCPYCGSKEVMHHVMLSYENGNGEVFHCTSCDRNFEEADEDDYPENDIFGDGFDYDEYDR